MLQRRDMDGIVVYTSPLLEHCRVPHAFSTRLGGVSDGPFASMNLGNPQGDVRDSDVNIAENYRRLQAAIGGGDRTRCWVHQVHGGAVIQGHGGQEFINGRPADAMVTCHPQHLLCIRTADCVPVLLIAAGGRRVAAVHAGWRGVIASAVSNAAAAMREPVTAAAIGPCISAEHFEVGPEVLLAFEQAFSDNPPITRRADGKGTVDLREAIRRQLLAMGLLATQIDTTDRCTVRDEEEYFSHRRDAGVTGRMAAVITPTVG